MRTPAVFALMFVALTTTPHRVESQGLGGLIKKKAAEAAKGKDARSDQGKTVAKDDGPIKSQFEKECGPLRPGTCPSDSPTPGWSLKVIRRAPP